MPIEFQCSQCEVWLRVPDAAAGTSVRCGKCRSVSTAPTPPSSGGPQQATEPTDGELGPRPSSEINPFSNPPLDESQPPANSDASWQPPDYESRMARAKSRVMPVGIVMVIISAIGLAFHALCLLGQAIQLLDTPQMDFALFVNVVVAIGWMLWSLLQFAGSIAMVRGGWVTGCWLAAGVSVVPATFCFPLSFPVGIWAIYTLYNPDVILFLRRSETVQASPPWESRAN